MRYKALLILAAMLLATASSASAASHVKAQLLADVKQIVPGKPFHLGVLLTLEPGWHVYWLNPGDSGQATKITLQLPKGFTAGEVQFPTPRLIVDPGNIRVYGYTDSVMFIATVTPDAKLAVGDANLSAKVWYLVCKDICTPGRASSELKLPVAANGTSFVAKMLNSSKIGLSRFRPLRNIQTFGSRISPSSIIRPIAP